MNICTIQKKDEKNHWVDIGDFSFDFLNDTNIKIQGLNGQDLTRENRLILPPSDVYWIKNITYDYVPFAFAQNHTSMDKKIEIEKDPLGSSFFRLERSGIEKKDVVLVPIPSYLENMTRDERFVENWIGVWARNLALNYQKIKDGKDIGYLLNIGKGAPCVIVGAGPSLDKNIQELKDINAYIICADRAYKTLLANGIEPDLVMNVDCHDELIFNYLNNVDSTNHTLVMNTCADYKIPEIWRGQVLFFNMRHDEIQFCRRVLPFVFPGVKSIPNLGCVINEAVVLAWNMRCDPIILVGCDFGYTEERMCAKVYDFIDGKFQEIEVNHQELFEKRTFKVEKNGIQTYTPYLEYLSTLIELQKKFRMNIINATEGGIITELPSMTLKEVKEKYLTQSIIKKIKEENTNVSRKGENVIWSG